MEWWVVQCTINKLFPWSAIFLAIEFNGLQLEVFNCYFMYEKIHIFPIYRQVDEQKSFGRT